MPGETYRLSPVGGIKASAMLPGAGTPGGERSQLEHNGSVQCWGLRWTEQQMQGCHLNRTAAPKRLPVTTEPYYTTARK